MAFSLVLHGTIPKDEMMGVVVGHCEFLYHSMVAKGLVLIVGSTVWYFFCDVYPSLHDGQRPLDPPIWWRRLFEGTPQDTGATPIDNEFAAAAAPEVR